jgi:predicted nucleotidyltransferase
VVDFAPDRTPGIAFFGLHRQFEAILGRPVDLLTRAMLDDRIRDSALNGAVTLYDAA